MGKSGVDYALQAIETKYLCPTDTQGGRIKAFCEAGSIVIPWRHDLETFENYKNAAGKLLKKLKWEYDMLGGATKKGYCFVLINKLKGY